VILCVEVALTIPDNEARTALSTLQRLGVPAATLERADLYRFDVAEDAAEALVAMLRGFEAVFNPSVHALRVRPGERPATGEVWVDEAGSEQTAPPVRIAGRALPGVRGLERFKAWRLARADGSPADAATLTAATETLLCNSAFQKVIRA
jgi:hypothetical protein